MAVFKEKDAVKVLNFIRENNFAVVTGVNANVEPVATQIPLLIVERGDQLFLRGHLMKNTDHANAFLENNNVLVVFTGYHCYVSASWYTNPKQGSTWNYCSVHAKGKLNYLPTSELVKILEELTNQYEKNTVASFKELPQTYIDAMTEHIVGFEIEVTSLENLFKLSQNRDKASYENIITELKKQDNCNALKIAAMMENNR